MKNDCFKAALVFSVFIVLMMVTGAAAEEKVVVAFLPFSVISDTDVKYLETMVPAQIARQVAQDGAQTIMVEAGGGQGVPDSRKLKEIGILQGADYLLTGSVFKAGDTISIDASLLKTFGSEVPTSFFTEIKGIETVNASLGSLANEISGFIFQRKMIVSIDISGNNRIESDAILRAMDTEKGDVFTQESLSSDLKKIFKMGYFDDVKIEESTTELGVSIAISVVEKPSVKRIRIKGNRIFDEEEVLEVVKTTTGSILNFINLEEDISRIKALYTEKNYHGCQINYEIETLEQNQANILIDIKEGEKLKVVEILFEGNTAFKAKKLKKEIETSEKGFFSWMTSSGDFDKDELDRDALKIEAFYKNNGYADARVADPVVNYEDRGIVIKFKILEGPRYALEKIAFTGDMLFTEEELRKKMKSRESEFYSLEALQNDVITIRDAYADKGYANADVSPTMKRNSENNTVSVLFRLEQKSPVYFERIIISGNTKTRDKVIRRQLKVYEQELYSKSKIQRSVDNLQRIDYFENVDVKMAKGEKENTVDLDFNIVEKATGAFSIGGGYSSEDDVFGLLSVSERNLFGRGQVLSFEAEVSGSSAKYTISFTEPWLFDIPLTFGVDLYNWDKEYDYYDKDTKGGAIRLGYVIFDYTLLGVKYAYEDFTISNVQEDYTDVDAGRYLTSSITLSLTYDNRNAAFNPSKGGEHRISVEYAGDYLGGEIAFTKYIAETGWYFPLFWKVTGFLHGRGGYLDDRTDDDIDIDYERFYLGGINSIRGYDSTDINTGNDEDDKVRGGEKFVQFNAEMIFPIVPEMKLVGVTFYDMGDVYRTEESIDLADLYSSFGGGIRWYSPVGPIRLEYGVILNGKEYASGKGRWEFAIGAAF